MVKTEIYRHEIYFCNITLYVKNILFKNGVSFLFIVLIVHNFLQSISLCYLKMANLAETCHKVDYNSDNNKTFLS